MFARRVRFLPMDSRKSQLGVCSGEGKRASRVVRFAKEVGVEKIFKKKKGAIFVTKGEKSQESREKLKGLKRKAEFMCYYSARKSRNQRE